MGKRSSLRTFGVRRLGRVIAHEVARERADGDLVLRDRVGRPHRGRPLVLVDAERARPAGREHEPHARRHPEVLRELRRGEDLLDEPVADARLPVAVGLSGADLVGVVDRQVGPLREGPALRQAERDEEARPVLPALAVVGVLLEVEPVVEPDRAELLRRRGLADRERREPRARGSARRSTDRPTSHGV